MKRALLASFLIASLAYAAIRGPGRKSGIVVRDRWGGCYLYSEAHLYYVSEHEKNKLSDVVSQPVVMDAVDVWQPINPGDALIRELVLLQLQPTEDEWVPVHDIQIETVPEFGSDQRPRFTIRVTNTARHETRFMAGALAATILAQRPSDCSRLDAPSDGPSFALITRESFWIGGPYTRGGGNGCGKSASWVLERGRFEDPLIMLSGEETREWSVRYDLAPGEYEFFAGYGGGVHAHLGLISNQIPFDVNKEGKASVAVAHAGGDARRPTTR